MNRPPWLRLGYGFVAAGLAITSGCVPAKKYSAYRSHEGDFACEVPAGWPVVMDRASAYFSQVLFTGPFEPSFYLGVPTLSVRWYRINAPRRLPNGSHEMYSSVQDFMGQMLRDVYGPDGSFKADADAEADLAMGRGETLPESKRIKISGREGVYFVAYHNAPAPEGKRDGVVSDNAGRRVILQRHGYAILPVHGGFYVLSYPATRDGFEKYKPAFFKLINSFRILKEGPR